MKNSTAIEQFLDRRFGMFIHWGVYSILAGEWQGKTVEGEIAEWIMNLLQIPVKEYEDIARQFNPDKFDADSLVKLARDAGMRYIVITTKHHDGFALFHSESDPYNIYDWTGCKRDVIAELSQACKKHGMKLGFYYSQALDWHEEHAGGWDVKPYGMRPGWANVWDYPDNERKDFAIYLEKKVKPQVTELLTKYGDVFLIWFDTPRTISERQSEELYQLVKSLQPNCLVNSRIGNGKGDYSSLGDNQIPTVPLTKPNESPVTLNDTWGYKHYDHNWKTGEEIIEMLMKLASRNVNFLLNIGPKGDGSLPSETVEILNSISHWTAQNGEAIYGTRGNPSKSDFDWGHVTVGANKVYLCLKQDEERKIEVNGLRTRVTGVYSLADQRSVEFQQVIDDEQDSYTLELDIPAANHFMPVYVMECEDVPEFHQDIYQQGDFVTLYPLLSQIFDGELKPGQAVKVENRHIDAKVSKVHIDIGGIVRGWSQQDEYIQWEAKFLRPGKYNVEVITGSAGLSDRAREDCRVEVLVGDSRVSTNLRRDTCFADSRTAANNTRVVSRAGRVAIEKPGIYRIVARLEQNLTDESDSVPLVALRFGKNNK